MGRLVTLFMIAPLDDHSPQNSDHVYDIYFSYDGCSSTALLHRRLYNHNVTAATVKESGPQSPSRPQVIHSADREKTTLLLLNKHCRAYLLLLCKTYTCRAKCRNPDRRGELPQPSKKT